MLVFCLIELDLCKLDSIGCLFLCCLIVWLSCESVMIGIDSFLVSVLRLWLILEILLMWLLLVWLVFWRSWR